MPDELEGLEKGLADTYFGNFSVFQSVPDHWAVKQLFPILPIHRLNERPTRRGVLADLTCDSDGKIDQFIDLRDVKNVARAARRSTASPTTSASSWSAPTRRSSATCTTCSATPTPCTSRSGEGGYHIDHVVEGDSVTEVLGYVQYQKQQLMQRMRQSNEEALRRGLLTFEESALLMRRYDEGLVGLHLPRGGRAGAAARERRDRGPGAARAPAPQEGDDGPGELPARPGALRRGRQRITHTREVTARPPCESRSR